MINKFCCDKFSFHYSGDKGMGLNIRIVKLSEAFIERSQLNNYLIFLITEGYNNIEDCKKITINFCPFCGTKLNSFYQDEKYVQETIDI